MKQWYYSVSMLAAAAVSAGLSSQVSAQQDAPKTQTSSRVMEEIIVNARRREENLQEVPVSMTVLTQESLSNANITEAGDLATYTPSLMTNTRFGSDSTNFAIRGFSQELRTTSSVAVYFAEVVAPRGANTTQSGDGAGPGDFFDLENVQVLKGPQGTLFGRNTTGGAVLLTPKRPTDELEGYAEVSAGNYDLKRAQGVVNIPINESFRIRLGVDHQQRDGYLNNISDIGPDDFADQDYTAARVSVLWDITENLENYTIAKWVESSNNGSPYSLLACNPAGQPFGSLCQADLDRRIASGNNGEYDVYNFIPESESELEQWQVINTTSWEINDDLTLKNIVSYAEFESTQAFALYGTDWRDFTGQHVSFAQINARATPTTSQKTWVEELQLQGTAFDESLTWQAGLYYERSEPIEPYGSQAPSSLSCDQSSVESSNPLDYRCNDFFGALFSGGWTNPTGLPPFSFGSVQNTPGGVTYTNKAVYLQGTYQFNDQWSTTAGIRYTNDETSGWVDETIYFFPGTVAGGYYAPAATIQNYRKPETSSEEPTWLLGVEYKPTDDMMLYAKYSRGYRQGSVNLASIEEWAIHEPEKVDTYELGLKTSFEGSIAGTFNVATFYNDFTNQQVQFGYLNSDGVGTTSILNAGASTIWGVEIDGALLLTDNFSVNYSYAYLNTNVDEINIPQAPYPAGVGIFSGTSTAEDEPLSYAPENSLVIGLNYHIPVDESLGDIVTSLTYVYTDDMQAVSKDTSPYATLPSYELVNLNLNWRNVMSSPVDVSMFVTNLFDEEYLTNITGNWSTGLEAGRVGVPRMYGARVRYNF